MTPEQRKRKIEINRDWRKRHRDKVRSWGRKYYRQKPAHCQEMARRYYHQQKQLHGERFLKAQAEKQRKRWTDRPDEMLGKYIQRNYHISISEYNAMVLAQGGGCAICGKPERIRKPGKKEPRRLAIDHCHRTGKVRGLLCHKCNAGIGHFEDRPDLLQKAAQWLSR